MSGRSSEGLHGGLLHAPPEEIAEAAEESSPEKAPSQNLIEPILEDDESGKSIQGLRVPEDHQGEEPAAGTDQMKQEIDQPEHTTQGIQDPNNIEESANIAEEIKRSNSEAD